MTTRSLPPGANGSRERIVLHARDDAVDVELDAMHRRNDPAGTLGSIAIVRSTTAS